MSCLRYKKLITLGLYSELSQADKDSLERHVQNCQPCSRMLANSRVWQSEFTNDDEITLPDWEKSWQVISAKAFPEGKINPMANPYKKWILAASLLLLVFMLGFFAGKRLFFSPAKPGLFGQQALVKRVSLLQQYAESLEPILIEFSNSSHQERSQGLPSLEREIIKDMLVQTRLLKHIANRKNVSHLQLLLEDLELILIGMSNLDPRDKQSADYLNDIIKEKGVRFKLKALAAPEQNI